MVKIAKFTLITQKVGGGFGLLFASPLVVPKQNTRLEILQILDC